MKKLGYLLLVILLLLTVNVKAADDCETKELQRLKELAKKIEFDYDYKVENNDVEFIINATNLNSELKALIIENFYAGEYQEFKGETTGSLGGFKSGERVVITIKGFVPNGCSGVTVLTRTIKIPYYNWFYDEEQCKGNENFKYCKILIDKDITRGEFNKQLARYIENEEKKRAQEEQKEPEEEKKDYKDLFMIIGGVILIIAIIGALIAIIIRRRKKNSL